MSDEPTAYPNAEAAAYWSAPSRDAVDVKTYGSKMVGRGEWALLADAETGTLHGIAWTDHKRAAGIFAPYGTDPAVHGRLVVGLHRCAADGVPASDAFGALVERYAPDTTYTGRLEELYAELNAD